MTDVWNKSLWRRHHCRWSPENFWPYTALIAFTKGVTFIVQHLLWRWVGRGVSSDGPPHLIASYDKQGAVMMRTSSYPDPEHNQTRGNTWFIFSKHAKVYALYKPALLDERTHNRTFKLIMRNRDRFCIRNYF